MAHVEWATASGDLKDSDSCGQASETIHYVAQMWGTRVRIFWREQLAGAMTGVIRIHFPMPSYEEPDQRAAAEAHAAHSALEVLFTVSGCHGRVEAAEDY